jgi:acyl-homoserine lactone acylase PvdQ
VTIYRDAYGTPHIDGATDEATLFGFAYAQAEDNFQQLDDNYILGQGRYSEVHGSTGLNSDLLNRAFEIVPNAQRSYRQLGEDTRALFDAYTAGLNYFLDKHPQIKPGLNVRFEPWHVMAFGRQAMLELCYRYTRLSSSFLPRRHRPIWTTSGSNGWAIGPKRTRGGSAMLMASPHLPWFGFSTIYEAHLRSGEGWDFSGAAFFGNPNMSLGHNRHLGWTLTTNEPDIADVWAETFDHKANPLAYRYSDGYRTATEWTTTIRVKSESGFADRKYTLRKTHHGPIVGHEGGSKYLAARIAGLDDVVMLPQCMRMVRAESISQFNAALAMQQFPLMNMLYADREGNIAYFYNGLIPRRDNQFNWSQPVDGADPQTEWQGIHTLAELPHLMNPADGFLQNCNSSPFTTCETGNLNPESFPRYMCEDANDDKRRAKMSRQLLRSMKGVDMDAVIDAALDTTVYWAKASLPDYQRRFKQLKQENPQLSATVEPYLAHLLDWDCRITRDSTQATLCAAWYEELFGAGYPAETLLPQFVESPEKEFAALHLAASKLAATYGDWRVRWSDVYRMQRHPQVVDVLSLPFEDQSPSLPSVAGPGPMGVIFTQYYTPTIRIPFVRTLNKRYGIVGTAYLAVYEFGDQVRGASALNFGVSGHPDSPHFSDQAALLSTKQLKPELLDWDEIQKACRAYQPGAAP